MKTAFTIIEMLVVITILASLMALTAGALASTRRSDKLLATEHLVGDLIRQARHTARTSGSPVVVLVEQDPPRIQGVSRVPVWSEDFDGSGGISGNIPAGMTGKGFQIDLTALGGQPPLRVLADSERLHRSANRNDGFYIGCQVLPPPITGGSGALLPLIVVGTPDASASGLIPCTASLCGLALRARTLPLQIVTGADSQGTGSGQQATLRTWEVFGWLGNGSAAPDEISSLVLDDRPLDISRDEQDLHPSVNPPVADIALPLAGGQWVELGLLVEPGTADWRMVLYRDGIRIAERRFPTPPVLRHADESVMVGAGEIIDPYSGSGVFIPSNAALFDGIVIARLATADPTPLPGGVAPLKPYRIVAHPDGRVEVNQVEKLSVTPDATTAAVSSDLIFTGKFNQAAQATLTVSVDGRVNGKLVTQ